MKKQLREVLGAKKIERSSKQNREKVLRETLGSIGIDKDRFMEDMEKVRKEQGNKVEMRFKI